MAIAPQSIDGISQHDRRDADAEIPTSVPPHRSSQGVRSWVDARFDHQRASSSLLSTLLWALEGVVLPTPRTGAVIGKPAVTDVEVVCRRPWSFAVVCRRLSSFVVVRGRHRSEACAK